MFLYVTDCVVSQGNQIDHIENLKNDGDLYNVACPYIGNNVCQEREDPTGWNGKATGNICQAVECNCTIVNSKCMAVNDV